MLHDLHNDLVLHLDIYELIVYHVSPIDEHPIRKDEFILDNIHINSRIIPIGIGISNWLVYLIRFSAVIIG